MIQRRQFCLLMGSASLVFTLAGCETILAPQSSARGGPPPWARARGLRRKAAYRYYFNNEVYFHVQNKEYVWREGGQWKRGRQVPQSVRLSRSEFVTLDLEGDRPEVHHDQVKRDHPKQEESRGRGRPDQPGQSRGRGGQGGRGNPNRPG